MLNQPRFKFLACAISGLVAVCFAAPAYALHDFDLSTFEAAQLAAGATHQWRFEGSDDAGRLDDSAGTRTLIKVAGVGGSADPDPMMVGEPGEFNYPAGDVNMIGFEAGLSGSSQAYRPQQTIPASAEAAEQLAQTRSGAGLYAGADGGGSLFSASTRMTVEAIVKPDGFQGTRIPTYILQGRNDDRLFFLQQTPPLDARVGQGNVTATIGTEFNPTAVLDPMDAMITLQPAGRPTVIPNYQADDWYYVAAVFDFTNLGTTPPANGARITAYYRNLSEDGPLVQSLDEWMQRARDPQLFVPVNLGVGLFVIPNADPNLVAAQEFFQGAIENLTIYKTALSDTTLAQHARGVPEPTTVVLLALGVLAIGASRRRR